MISLIHHVVPQVEQRSQNLGRVGSQTRVADRVGLPGLDPLDKLGSLLGVLVVDVQIINVSSGVDRYLVLRKLLLVIDVCPVVDLSKLVGDTFQWDKLRVCVEEVG